MEINQNFNEIIPWNGIQPSFFRGSNDFLKSSIQVSWGAESILHWPGINELCHKIFEKDTVYLANG